MNVRCLGDKAGEARLRWSGRVQRRDSEYMSRRIELVGSGPRGRAKVRLMDSDIEREGSWREGSGCRGWV